MIAAAAVAAIAMPAGADAQQVSTNWAGYVAVTRTGHSFSTVAGTWVVPTASCRAGHATYSAMWVGLGGYRQRAKGLEQIGTAADCARKGSAAYAAWLEILPAAPIAIRIKVRPGDTMAASTTLAASGVTLRIRDLTTGARYATTRHASPTDASSAEWIVEAPSVCSNRRACTALPLADFGTAAFESASATSQARTAPASDAAWAATAIELQQESVVLPAITADAQAGPTRTLVSASPSTLTAPAGAFTVSWSERTTQLPQPSAPTLPGFGA
jgi:hypothetical protein